MILVAHRLNSSPYPPNSLESFHWLVRFGLRAVEFDVIDDAARIIVGRPDQVAPELLEHAKPLSDFLQVGGESQIEMFIDLKPRAVPPNQMARNILTLVERRSSRQTAVITSRDESVLKQAREAKFRTGHIVDIETQRCGDCTYNLVSIEDKRNLTSAEVERTILTEVQTPEQFHKSKEMGVPYAMSDRASELFRNM